MRLSFRRPLRWMVLALGCASAWAAAPPTEYQVKAAYLFNFGQFVEWPATAWDSPTAPFGICIVGEDPFGSILDEVVRGESINGHQLVVRRFSPGDAIAGCNILFIGRSETADMERLLGGLRGKSILTVTDATGAESRGAVIVLVIDNNRVRLRINIGAARANNLVISSKLLRPAEVVGNGPGT